MNYTFTPEFEARLKKLRIKKKFIRNIINYHSQKTEREIREFLSNGRDCNWWYFISSPFLWGDSPEGLQYWSKIANKKWPTKI